LPPPPFGPKSYHREKLANGLAMNKYELQTRGPEGGDWAVKVKTKF
jgi:hypothetical protein